MLKDKLQSIKKWLWFNWVYLFDPPWDSGVPAPELQAFITDKQSGKALDLGCGTGTNLIFLARQGWCVDGIDFSRLAIHQARRKVKRHFRRSNAIIRLLAGDVSRMEALDLRHPFDLVLDIGCLHALGDEQAARDYAAGLCKVLRSGGDYLLYAHQTEAETPTFPEHGLTEPWVKSLFTPALTLVEYRLGTEGTRDSAWYYLKKI